MKSLNSILSCIVSASLALTITATAFCQTDPSKTDLANITKDIPDNWWDGGWDKLSELQSFISKYPDKPALCAQARYRIGNYYQSAGNFDSAISAYDTVISTYSDSAIECSKAQYEKAQIYFYHFSDYAAAIKEYQKVISDYPDNDLKPVAQLMIGKSYIGSANYPLAEESLKKIRNDYPKATYQQFEAYMELGSLSMGQSLDSTDSKKKISQAISYYKKAFSICEPKAQIVVVDNIYESLKRLDGSPARANQFIKYQKYGPQGEDRVSGTQDDLTDPIAEF